MRLSHHIHFPSRTLIFILYPLHATTTILLVTIYLSMSSLKIFIICHKYNTYTVVYTPISYHCQCYHNPCSVTYIFMTLTPYPYQCLNQYYACYNDVSIVSPPLLLVLLHTTSAVSQSFWLPPLSLMNIIDYLWPKLLTTMTILTPVYWFLLLFVTGNCWC